MTEVKTKSVFRAGGAATAGGMNFQAAVTAIVQVHIIRQKALGWLSGLQNDLPLAVSAETSGPGDDLKLEYRDKTVAEVQVKKGLKKGPKLWSSLESLAKAIQSNQTHYGIIVVCANSSQNVSRNLANDLERIGNGRVDNLKPISKEFLTRLNKLNLSVKNICARLRIITIHALHTDNPSILAAKAELEHVCLTQSDVPTAWNVLLTDSSFMIENRSRRTEKEIYKCLESQGVNNTNQVHEISKLDQQVFRNWVSNTNSSFRIIGLSESMPLVEFWLPLNAFPVESQDEEDEEGPSLNQALEAYHNWNSRNIDKYRDCIDPTTIGRFYNLNVVISGPGMGKSTLLKKLACIYSSDGFLVLKVNLRAVRAKMKTEGSGFRESIFKLGLDGFDGSEKGFEKAKVSNWIILCDGLDECGSEQALIIEGLKKLSKGFPDYRIIVATRPVGYSKSSLSEWRHYEISPFSEDGASRNIESIINSYLEMKPKSRVAAIRRAKSFLDTKNVKNLAIRSPLLISLVAALSIKAKKLSGNKFELFESIFLLMEDKKSARISDMNSSQAYLGKIIDILGYQNIHSPLISEKSMEYEAAKILANELKCSELIAKKHYSEGLKYWEDIGVVERLNCGLENTITFIHKTFAEYTAARYINDLPASDRLDEIKSTIQESDWVEVVNFLAGLGHASLIINCLDLITPTRGSDFDRLEDKLRILSSSPKPNDDGLIEKATQEAIKLISSKRRIRSLTLGTKIVALAVSHPKILAENVGLLALNSSLDLRLIGWACLTSCGRSFYDVVDLKKFLVNDLPLLLDVGFKASLGGGMMFGSANSELVSSVILKSVEDLLQTETLEDVVDLIPEEIRKRRYGSVGLHIKLESIFSEEDVDYTLADENSKGTSTSYSIFESFRKHDKARKDFCLNHLPYLMDIDLTPEIMTTRYSDELKLYNLAAFFQLTDNGSEPIYDIQAWQEDYDKEASREVFRAFMVGSNIPLNELKTDVKIYVSLAAQITDEQSFGLYRHLPDVDIPPIDWDKLKLDKIDASLSERAMHHKSEWMSKMAIHVLHAKTPKTSLKPVVQRLLKSTRGFNMHLACLLAGELDERDTVAVLTERARLADTWGCSYIYDQLGKEKKVDEEKINELLALGLFSKYVSTSVSAAKLAGIHKPLLNNELETTLNSAYIYWKKHEKPYPVKGGAVPDSPRCNILKIIELKTPHSYDQSVEFCRDERSDVREFGLSKLAELIEQKTSTRQIFIQETIKDKLPTSAIRHILKSQICFGSEEISLLSELIDHSSAQKRYAALELLAQKEITDTDKNKIIDTALADKESQIVDRVTYLADNLM